MVILACEMTISNGHLGVSPMRGHAILVSSNLLCLGVRLIIAPTVSLYYFNCGKNCFYLNLDMFYTHR